MLWNVSHRCSSGARFALNFYWHKTLLVIHRPETVFSFIMSRDEVTQGNPLLAVLYGLPLPPLSESMREEEPEVLQLWYKYDAAMMRPREWNVRLLHTLM